MKDEAELAIYFADAFSTGKMIFMMKSLQKLNFGHAGSRNNFQRRYSRNSIFADEPFMVKGESTVHRCRCVHSRGSLHNTEYFNCFTL